MTEWAYATYLCEDDYLLNFKDRHEEALLRQIDGMVCVCDVLSRRK